MGNPPKSICFTTEIVHIYGAALYPVSIRDKPRSSLNPACLTLETLRQIAPSSPSMAAVPARTILQKPPVREVVVSGSPLSGL